MNLFKLIGKTLKKQLCWKHGFIPFTAAWLVFLYNTFLWNHSACGSLQLYTPSSFHSLKTFLFYAVLCIMSGHVVISIKEANLMKQNIQSMLYIHATWSYWWHLTFKILANYMFIYWLRWPLTGASNMSSILTAANHYLSW